MIIVNVSGTRKDIRWMIKNISRNKRISFLVPDISNIKRNEKNPQYSHVLIKLQRENQYHPRESPYEK